MAEYVKATLAELPTDASVATGSRGWVTTGDKIYEWDGDSWVLRSIAGAALVSDAVSLSGNAQGSVSLTTTAAQSAALTGGIYDVWATVDCYIKVNATANDVTTSTGYLLRAGNTIPLQVPDQEKIGGIVSSGTATLYYHKVK